MTPEEQEAEEAYEEALRRIREADATGAVDLDLGVYTGVLPYTKLKALDRLPPELSHLTSLQSLNLRGCQQLSDLSPLAGLTSLQSLDLSQCEQISDLSPLSGLTSLQSLDLSWCKQLSDLSPLAGLTSLRWLNLAHCYQLSEFSLLASLTSLQSLNLEACIWLSYLSPIAGLISLRSLNLSKCWRLSDLSPLASLTSLCWLNLAGCNHLIGDLSSLSSLTSLKKLNLRGCRQLIGDLSSLSSLTSLQKLNLKGCNQLIGDLSSLSSLTSLHSLDLAGCNHLTGDLSPLSSLTSLQKLDLAGCNHLTGDLSPLSSLTSLHSLDIRGCNHLTGDLSPLSSLTSLHMLNLAGCNHLTDDLSPLSSLTSLRSLSLNKCLTFRRFAPLESLLFTLKELHLFCCELEDLPAEICGEAKSENVIDKVRAHYQDLRPGQRIDAEIRVLFLGNGGVGKTQLCRRLRGGLFDPTGSTTHGIQLGQVIMRLDDFPEPIRLNLWDFGGQDIYHGSHALFLQGQAIFLILWTPELERGGSYEEGNVTLRHRPLSYWLDYVRNFAGAEASVIIVQSQCDTASDRAARPSAATHGSPFLRWLEVSAKTGLGLKIVNGAIEEAVRDRFARRPPPPIGAGRVKVRDRLRIMLATDQQLEPSKRRHRLLERTEFDSICDEMGGVSETGALLDYLHHNGLIFYRKGLFGNRIILDQNWALEAIYSIFHREKCFEQLKKLQGRFSREDLERLIWFEYTVEEQKVFLGMMESCGICFQVRNLPNDDWEYIAPELLPTWSDAQKLLLIGRIPKDQAIAQAEARYEFLHEGVLRGYLSKIGRHASDAAIYWKYGCWFYEETTDSRVLIEGLWDHAETEAGSGMIRFRAWGENAESLIEPLLEVLQILPLGRPPEIIWQGGGLDEQNKKGLDDMMITEPPAAATPQVFVSYAWGNSSSDAPEEDRQRQEVVERLCQKLEKDDWKVIRDKDALQPGDLLSAFMTKLGQADCVIVVLSAKYLRSTACMTELYDLYRNAQQQKGDFLKRIIPLVLKDANISNWRGRATHAEHWESEFKEMEPHFTHLGVEDLKLYKAIRRWHNEVGDMLAYVNDVLAPHGFDEIVKDDFASLRQMLQRRR